MGKATGKAFFGDVIRSILYGVIFTLLFILVFSIPVKLFEPSQNVLRTVNQVLKVLSIFLGLAIGIKDKEGYFKKGILTGIIFAAITTLLFSLFTHDAFLTKSTLIEVAVGAIAGAISGLILKLIKK